MTQLSIRDLNPVGRKCDNKTNHSPHLYAPFVYCPGVELAPIEYIPDLLPKDMADEMYHRLMNELDWVQVEDVPRAEYYVNDTPVEYVYGFGRGRRAYQPQPYHPVIEAIRGIVEDELAWGDDDINRKYQRKYFAYNMDVCFLNRYDDARKGLGWHADDSPEMDPLRPIVTVSLGAERHIQFRKNGDKLHAEDHVLGHGSACIMKPGMQLTWQHRIPKASWECGPRISLTFRGYRPLNDDND